MALSNVATGNISVLVLSAVSGAGVLYLAAYAVYTLFFHPLSKYPGPLLAKFTNAYAAYHGWKGDIHLDMWRCHEKYGPHVRYAPNSLLFQSAAALRDIYGTGSAARVVKSRGYGPMVHRAPNTLTIRGGREHARRRRIMSQGVSEKAQRGYERRVMTHIERFCAVVYDEGTETKDLMLEGPQEDGWGEAMDVAKWCNYLSFDIMADVVFGASYNLLQVARFRYVTEAIDASNRRMSALIQAPRLAALKLDKYVFRAAITARNRFVKFVSRVVKERLDKEDAVANSAAAADAADNDAAKKPTGAAPTDDVFANLARARDPETGSGFSRDEIAAESATLIVAGSDTSSTAIAAALFYLAHNGAAYARAAAEVRAAFAASAAGSDEGSDSDCSDSTLVSSSSSVVRMGAALASCAYLRACVDEALRMSPPVGSALWREALPGGCVVDGVRVEAGTDVGVAIYAIHHAADHFDAPWEYRPERWLERGQADRGRDVFNPFSVGIRGCLGKGLAMTEIMLTVASLLNAGDFRLAEGQETVGCGGKNGAEYGRHRQNEFQLWDHVTGQKHGPVLQFRKRTVA